MTSFSLTLLVTVCYCNLSYNVYRRLNNNNLSGPVPLPLASLPQLTFLWVLAWSFSKISSFCSCFLFCCLIWYELLNNIGIHVLCILETTGICHTTILLDLFLLFLPKHLSMYSNFYCLILNMMPTASFLTRVLSQQ